MFFIWPHSCWKATPLSREDTKASASRPSTLPACPHTRWPSLLLCRESPQPSFIVSPPPYYCWLSVFCEMGFESLLSDFPSYVACIDKLGLLLVLSFVAGIHPNLRKSWGLEANSISSIASQSIACSTTLIVWFQAVSKNSLLLASELGTLQIKGIICLLLTWNALSELQTVKQVFSTCKVVL